MIDKIEEIIEEEYFATCCNLRECVCYERFKANVRRRIQECLKDMKNKRLLEEFYEQALDKWEKMNKEN